ncbi:MAG TPA: class I tRNA ligase family protein, partial [Vicinamibacteria bacterium]|nr:class I tRNA ligase family protein [Vicinamibacteria bacterium]
AIREATETLLLLLAPFAPHIAEDLWETLGHQKPIGDGSWPAPDPAIAAEDRLTLVVQVNGKLRGRLSIGADEDDETIKKRALEDENVKRFLEGKDIVRVVVVPKRLVNVVVA